MRARLSTPHFLLYTFIGGGIPHRAQSAAHCMFSHGAHLPRPRLIYIHIYFHSRAVSTVMRAPRSPQNWLILCNVFYKNIDYYAALPLRHKIPFCALCRSIPTLSPFRAVAPLPRQGGYTPRGRRGRLTPINTLPRKARPD